MMIEVDANGVTICGKFRLVPTAEPTGDPVLDADMKTIDEYCSRRALRLMQAEPTIERRGADRK